MIAEPLEQAIASDIEDERVTMRMTPYERRDYFKEYQWDILATRSIWAFGPAENGPNILVNDTLPAQVLLFIWHITWLIYSLFRWIGQNCGRHESI